MSHLIWRDNVTTPETWDANLLRYIPETTTKVTWVFTDCDEVLRILRDR